jgi:acyl-coenzyme A synthetase/AMP-(fatty) acid ligase
MRTRHAYDRSRENSPAQLRSDTKERMVAHRYPRIVDVMVELPETVTSRIARRRLRPNSEGAV